MDQARAPSAEPHQVGGAPNALKLANLGHFPTRPTSPGQLYENVKMRRRGRRESSTEVTSGPSPSSPIVSPCLPGSCQSLEFDLPTFPRRPKPRSLRTSDLPHHHSPEPRHPLVAVPTAIAGEVQPVPATDRAGPAHGSTTSGARYHSEERMGLTAAQRRYPVPVASSTRAACTRSARFWVRSHAVGEPGLTLASFAVYSLVLEA